MLPHKHPIRLRVYEESPGVAYIELIDFPQESRVGIVDRTVSVDLLIPNYDGPRINIDFDAKGIAIGIEILYPFDYVQQDDDRTDE